VESDGISRVVRNGGKRGRHVADSEVLARLDGFNAFEPLANVFREHARIASRVGSVT